MWHLNEIRVSGATRFTRRKVTLTVWEIWCVRDKGLGRSGCVCSRKRDCRLGGWALNNITEGDSCWVGGVETEGNRRGG